VGYFRLISDIFYSFTNMKNILFILLTLSILSTGCSKEDDVQITQEVTNNLDENLYGVWEQISGNYYYYRSFSSNGKSGYWYENSGNGVPIGEYSFDWWVEDGYIVLDSESSSTSTILSYSVSGNSLTLNQGIWTKQ